MKIKQGQYYLDRGAIWVATCNATLLVSLLNGDCMYDKNGEFEVIQVSLMGRHWIEEILKKVYETI